MLYFVLIVHEEILPGVLESILRLKKNIVKITSAIECYKICLQVFIFHTNPPIQNLVQTKDRIPVSLKFHRSWNVDNF